MNYSSWMGPFQKSQTMERSSNAAYPAYFVRTSMTKYDCNLNFFQISTVILLKIIEKFLVLHCYLLFILHIFLSLFLFSYLSTTFSIYYHLIYLYFVLTFVLNIIWFTDLDLDSKN